MPTTLTLKNIPDALYERLKRSAEMHRRSLNSEALVYLERALTPHRIPVAERLARIRQIRESISASITNEEISAWKREGRL